MTFGEVLGFIIEDGIEAAKGSYAKPDQRLKLAGAVRGFEECRGKTPPELANLLQEAEQASTQAMHGECVDYWYWRCRSLEVGWVCNVLGGVLMAQGLPKIPGSMVTVRGVEKAAEIIGIAGV